MTPEKRMLSCISWSHGNLSDYFPPYYQVDVVADVEEPSNSEQNPVADDSQDQELKGPSGSAKGRLLIACFL